MKNVKKGSRIALLLGIVLLVALLVSCELPKLPTAPTRLTAPELEISETGLATWEYVPNAYSYKYKINDGEELSTNGLKVQLSPGDTIVVKAVGDGKKYKDSAWSESKQFIIPPEKLPTPSVSISADGIASWPAVPNATSYEYKINNGNVIATSALAVTLSDGQSITVRAIGNWDTFTESDWSTPKLYALSENPPATLATPTVIISENGLASWTAVEGATHYEYKINGGAPVSAVFFEITLSDGDTIVVRALGNNAESPYSEPKTYTAPSDTPPSTQKTKLPAPSVTISQSGVASWAAITGASSYAYKIDNGTVQYTSSLSVKLSDGQSITVRAIGDAISYEDSNYSTSCTFVCTHADLNSNGKCDYCNITTVIIIDFYAINDIHGSLMDTSSHPGVDEFMTYMSNKYADTSAYEVLISSGDMWQGTVESSSNKGRLMTEWMNMMDFVSMTIGNHEYDWGAAEIKNNAQFAEFPFLAINIRYNGQTVDYCQPSVIVERGGVKIGIIGAIGNVKSSISGEFTSGLEFISGSALTTLVQNEAKRLRDDEGCDIIVYSIHSNSDDYDTVLSNKQSGKGYVDVVFEAHSHSTYANTDTYGVPHVQAGGYNTAISYVSFSFNVITDTYLVSTYKTIPKSEYASSSLASDPALRELYDKYFPENDPYTTVIGYNSTSRSSTVLKSLITKLYLDFGKQQWSGYDIAIAGGKINPRDPYTLPAGNVTYAQLFQLFPFDNSIILGRMKGSDINSKFINGSLNYTLGSASSFSSNQYYYVITDSYTAYYSSNNIEIIDSIGGTYARDLLAQHVKSGGFGTRNSVRIVADARRLRFVTVSQTVIESPSLIKSRGVYIAVRLSA